MKLSKDILMSLVNKATLSHDKRDIYGQCPFCYGDEWGISVEKDNHLWSCFRKSKCGETGNIYKFLKKINRLDLITSGGKEIVNQDEKLKNIIEEKIEKNIDIDMETISLPLEYKRIHSNFYLEDRGFDSFEKMEVGKVKFGKLKDYVIFPIRESGEVKAYIARSTKSKEEIKEQGVRRYRNSETDFSKLLVGYDEINESTSVVILTEGIMGKEAIDRYFKGEGDIVCCSTSGAKLSEAQIFKLQLKGVKNIIIFFDLDVINKIKKHSLELLNEFKSVNIVISPDEKKDPADLTKDELIYTFSNPVDPITFYLNKVQILNIK